MKYYPAIIFVLFCTSCGGDANEADIRSFQIADSLFQRHTSDYFKEADSLCRQMNDTQLPYWVDSLLQQRRKEVEMLRK
jgi:hypothetical protein